MKKEKYLLSVSTEKDGDIVYIHANKKGLEALSQSIERLKRNIDNNECDHDHLFSDSWGGEELTETMVEQEADNGCKQVHHIKIYSWTDEWADKHNLLKSNKNL